MAEIVPRSATKRIRNIEYTEELHIYISTDGISDYVNKWWEYAGKLYQREF
jgi:hypothetical protein